MEKFVGGLAVVRADQKGSVFKHQAWFPFLQLLRNFQYKIRVSKTHSMVEEEPRSCFCSENAAHD